jgi:hypothetical protein
MVPTRMVAVEHRSIPLFHSGLRTTAGFEHREDYRILSASLDTKTDQSQHRGMHADDGSHLTREEALSCPTRHRAL